MFDKHVQVRSNGSSVLSVSEVVSQDRFFLFRSLFVACFRLRCGFCVLVVKKTMHVSGNYCGPSFTLFILSSF